MFVVGLGGFARASDAGCGFRQRAAPAGPFEGAWLACFMRPKRLAFPLLWPGVLFVAGRPCVCFWPWRAVFSWRVFWSGVYVWCGVKEAVVSAPLRLRPSLLAVVLSFGGEGVSLVSPCLFCLDQDWGLIPCCVGRA